MNSKIKNFLQTYGSRIINISFCFVIAVSLLGILLRAIVSDDYHVTNISGNWTDETGAACSLSGFDGYDSATKTFSPQRVYYTMDSTKIDTAVIFRARSCYVNVYINDILVDEDPLVTSPVYGASPGSRWHIVSLGASETPVTLCLEVTTCYTNSHGMIDNIYLGNTRNIYQQVVQDKILGFILSNVLWMAGIVILLLYFYMQRRNKAGKDLLYLGFATLFSSQWLIAESLLWQLFWGHSEMIHLFGYTALCATPLAYSALAAYRLKGKIRTFAIIYSAVSTVVLIVSTALHLFCILEFHYTLVFTRILLFFIIPLIIPLVQSYTNDDDRNSHKIIILPMLGILVVCIAISLIKYFLGSYNDYSSYVRIALLCFLLCLIVYQFNQVVTTFTKGMKADMLHNLALTDHLTGLYNRTAFNEHTPEYDHIIASFSPLGIIQFDVNNLKKVNDTLGHEKGDQMIKAVANGLNHAFAEYHDICFSYRTGGDEFLTIINAVNADEIYHTCIQRLMSYCEEFNKQPNLDFSLVIAHGYVLTKGNTTLSEAIDEADVLMYENKRQLKALAANQS